VQEITGGMPAITNNRMELQAVIESVARAMRSRNPPSTLADPIATLYCSTKMLRAEAAVRGGYHENAHASRVPKSKESLRPDAHFFADSAPVTQPSRATAF